MSIISQLLKKLNPSDLTEEEKRAVEAELRDEGEGEEKTEEKVEMVEEKKDEEVKETTNEKQEDKSEAMVEENNPVVEEKVEEKAVEEKKEIEIPIDSDTADASNDTPVVEEVKKIEEEKVEEKPLTESDAVSKLVAQQELLMKQNEELQAKIESLSKEKALIDSQKKLDEAMAEGWLTPAMLKENAEGAESVFVTLAKDYPELFDRLKLVMAPKVIKKTAITEESSSLASAMDSDEAKYEVVNKYAADHKIPYMEAARIIGGSK